MASRLQEGVVGGGDRDKDWALQYKVRWLEEKMDLMQQRYVSLEEKVNRMMLIRFPEDDADTPHADATGVEKQHQEMPSASTCMHNGGSALICILFGGNWARRCLL